MVQVAAAIVTRHASRPSHVEAAGPGTGTQRYGPVCRSFVFPDSPESIAMCGNRALAIRAGTSGVREHTSIDQRDVPEPRDAVSRSAEQATPDQLASQRTCRSDDAVGSCAEARKPFPEGATLTIERGRDVDEEARASAGVTAAPRQISSSRRHPATPIARCVVTTVSARRFQRVAGRWDGRHTTAITATGARDRCAVS